MKAAMLRTPEGAQPTATCSPARLSRADADALAAELDALRAEIVAELGARDVAHIRAVIRAAAAAEAAGRALLAIGVDPLSFVAGTGALALAKILENMEIGHNVMHGQYDWTGDETLDSHAYEWDIVCAGEHWRHSHNFEHHTYTNIVGRDRDVGYGILRVSEVQPWRPLHLIQPVTALSLALLFQWGVALHDLRIYETLAGEQSVSELAERSRPFFKKAGWQLLKDYALYPALALWNAPRVAAGNLLANGARNLWTFAVIFCGHFPAGVHFYREDEVTDERRGHWYARQLSGSANLEGGRLFHILTGHLSFQIEHHLFPDLPASRYPQIAPRVRAICERYGQSYVTGSLRQQVKSVASKLVRHALPKRARRARATTTALPAAA